MEIKEIQEKLLMLLPHWNYRIIRPVKQLLDDGISLEMYYCLQTLRWGGAMTMTDFANYVQIPKHQMSKMSNRLFEQGFIERIPDGSDRRIIRIKITEKAIAYMDQFLEQNTSCFREFLEQAGEQEKNEFGKAIDTIFRFFSMIAKEEAKE
mgnify:CR=1 FL=1